MARRWSSHGPANRSVLCPGLLLVSFRHHGESRLHNMVVKACTFDVFGTCVDWRTSVVSMLEDEFRKKGHDDRIGDCPKIAQDWRSGYSRYNASVFSGEVPKENVKTIDIVHREILDDLALKYSFRQFFQPQELDDMNLIWHKLIPWPDTPIGIIALKRKCIVSTLSNGNMRLLVDQAKFAGMEWDILLSSELYRSAKPHQDVYLGAAKMLNLRPEEVGIIQDTETSSTD